MIKVKRPQGWQTMPTQIIGSFEVDGKEPFIGIEFYYKK